MDYYGQIFPVFEAEFVNSVLRQPYWPYDVRNICEPPAGDLMADNRTIACAFAKSLEGEPCAVKQFEHFNQVAITQRFQEFVDDFSEENQEGTLLDLS